MIKQRSARPFVLSEGTLWIAIALMPFQQALTIDLGFPLKASEVLAVIGLFLTVLESRRGAGKAPGVGLLGLLALLVAVSSFWTAATDDGAQAPLGYERGMGEDLFLYTAYAMLALAFAWSIATTMTAERVSSAVGMALRLAAVYSLVQVGTWAGGSDLLGIVNGTTQVGTLYGVGLPRNGPFLEGNYFGFFAATGTFVAARGRDRLGVAIGIALILYSQSTGAVLAVGAGLFAILVLRPRARSLATLGLVGLVGVASIALVPQINGFVLSQLTKLGLVENTLGEAYGYSLRGRSANAETGFSMAMGNPILGVGQGRYGAHYSEYLDLTGLPPGFGNGIVRPIANNSYAQIAAETGLPALAVLIALLLLLALRARKTSSAVLGLVAAVSVGLAASPSWTGLPVWAMIGIAMAFCRVVDEEALQSRARRPMHVRLKAR